jgi:hypothetical protein
MTSPATMQPADPIPRSRVGVYVLANDTVAEWLRAFVASYRTYNVDLPLCLIPFDESTRACEDIVGSAGGMVHRDPVAFAALERIGSALELGHTPTGPHWFRRFVAFDGPFDSFAYLDCRTLVLGDLRPFALAPEIHDVPLVHYDCAINQVYNDGDVRLGFCRSGLAHGFLSNIWASRRGLFSLERMVEAGRALEAVRDQMNPRNTDQFFLNYLCDSAGVRACHMADLDSRYAHVAWAGDRGTPYEAADGTWRKWDFGGLQHKRQMLFVHWAGIRLHPAMPHYGLHRRFRHGRVGLVRRAADAVRQQTGRWFAWLRGNRPLNTLYHDHVRRSARRRCP